MTDQQDDDALFEKLAKSLDAVRHDAEMARSGGTAGLSASIQRLEVEVRRAAAGLEALSARCSAQEQSSAARDAALGSALAEVRALRQAVDALSRRPPEQEVAEAEEPAPGPAGPGRGQIVMALATPLLVVALLGTWIGLGWHPTLGQLADRFTGRLAQLAGYDPPPRPEVHSPAAPVPAVAAVQPFPHPSPPMTAAPTTSVESPSQDASPEIASTFTASPATGNPTIVDPAGQPAPAPAPENPAAAKAASTSPASTEPPPPPPPAQAPRQMLLRANADSWVEIRQKGGKTLLRKTMKAGETWPVPADPTLLLSSGNPGALELVVDGTATRLVPKGGVVHDMPLEPGSGDASAKATP